MLYINRKTCRNPFLKPELWLTHSKGQKEKETLGLFSPDVFCFYEKFTPKKELLIRHEHFHTKCKYHAVKRVLFTVRMEVDLTNALTNHSREVERHVSHNNNTDNKGLTSSLSASQHRVFFGKQDANDKNNHLKGNIRQSIADQLGWLVG